MISDGLRAASDDRIKSAVAQADPMVLRAAVYHATGDKELVDLKTETVSGIFSDMEAITDPDSLALLRSKAVKLLTDYRDGTAKPPAPDADEERLRIAMTLAVGTDVVDREFPFWLEELAIQPQRRALQWKKNPARAKLDKFRVLVIGAGLGGIGAGVQLKKAGFNFEIIEKNSGVGGTWYQNRYPGARVDLPSRIYSHSFAMDYQFTYPFSPQAENEDYINWCVDSNQLRDRIRFNTEVEELRWDEAESVWLVRIRQPDGSRTVERARAVISAVGLLDRPQIPDFPGLKDFKGQKLHTTKLKITSDFTDKRVAVIGTGATGMQLVPDLQRMVKHLTIFQRSPAWVLPVEGYRDPYPDGVAWLNRNMPYYGNWVRFGQAWACGDHCLLKIYKVDPNWPDPHTVNAENFKVRERCVSHLMEKLAGRPDLVEKTLPDYPPFAKRQVVDNGWFDAIKQANVDLVHDDPIVRFTEKGVVTRSGREVPLDAAIFATGFRPNDYFWPMEITGRNGVTVSSVWGKDGARAFWGINVVNMPNFFCIYGPNTNPKNTGPVPYGEMQVRYILKCLEAIIENDWNYIDVRADVFTAHNVEVDRRQTDSIFKDKRQKSYYTNEHGRSAVASPWETLEYWSKLREPDFREYVIGTASTTPSETQMQGSNG